MTFSEQGSGFFFLCCFLCSFFFLPPEEGSHTKCSVVIEEQSDTKARERGSGGSLKWCSLHATHTQVLTSLDITCCTIFLVPCLADIHECFISCTSGWTVDTGNVR